MLPALVLVGVCFVCGFISGYGLLTIAFVLDFAGLRLFEVLCVVVMFLVVNCWFVLGRVVDCCYF